MLASDILNLTFFPKGAILMFNGANYLSLDQNIWKICDGKNGTPNLINKFLRGSTDSGATGGADNRSVTLTTAQLPSHSHGITNLSIDGLSTSGLTIDEKGNHTHTLSGGTSEGGSHEHALSGKAASAGGHSHGITDPKHSHSVSAYAHSDGGSGQLTGGNYTNGVIDATVGTDQIATNITIDSVDAHEHSFSSDSKATMSSTHTHDFSSLSSATLAGSHSHTISGSIGGSIGGSLDNTGSGTAFTVDTLPSYYAVIYIMKIV
jgi:hypothetical protein